MVKSSWVVVRNSSVLVMEVVLTEGPLEFVVVVEGGVCTEEEVFALVWEMLEEEVIFVDCSVGAIPVACWMSLPCSEIRLGPS